jgi:hypothetical protein
MVAAGGAAVTAGVATGGAGTLGSGLVAKGLAVAAIAAGAGGGGLIASHELKDDSTKPLSLVDATRSTTHRPTPRARAVSPAAVFGTPVRRGPAARGHGPRSSNGRHLGTSKQRPRPATAAPLQVFPPAAAPSPKRTGSGTNQPSATQPSATQPSATQTPAAQTPDHPAHPTHPGHPAHPQHPASDDGGQALGQDRSPEPPGQAKKDVKEQ